MEVVCGLYANAMPLYRRGLSLSGPQLFSHHTLTATEEFYEERYTCKVVEHPDGVYVGGAL